MANSILINNKINKFNKSITVSGDKSISIRWILFASLANGISKSKNLLISEDVLAAINCIKKLGIKVVLTKNSCKIYGNGIDGYKYKKNLILDAKNSGTLARLILGFLINTPHTIKLIGDKSLSKRDFKRIADPLSEFGARFKSKKKVGLPILEYQERGTKWVIENHDKETAKAASDKGILEVEISDPKQQVYVYNCEEVTIKINGAKFKSIIVDKCVKVNVIFPTIISGCEIVNSKKIAVQSDGVCPVFTIDKTVGVSVYLSKESAEISSFLHCPFVPADCEARTLRKSLTNK